MVWKKEKKEKKSHVPLCCPQAEIWLLLLSKRRFRGEETSCALPGERGEDAGSYM